MTDTYARLLTDDEIAALLRPRDRYVETTRHPTAHPVLAEEHRRGELVKVGRTWRYVRKEERP